MAGRQMGGEPDTTEGQRLTFSHDPIDRDRREARGVVAIGIGAGGEIGRVGRAGDQLRAGEPL